MGAMMDASLEWPLWVGILCGGPFDGEIVKMYAPIRPPNVIRGEDGTLAQSSAPRDEVRSRPGYVAYLAGRGSEYWYVPVEGE